MLNIYNCELANEIVYIVIYFPDFIICIRTCVFILKESKDNHTLIL